MELLESPALAAACSLVLGVLIGIVVTGLLLRGRLLRSDAQADAQRTELERQREQIDRAQAESRRLDSELAANRATLAAQLESSAEKLKLLESTREEMTTRFKQLSQEILEEKSKRFSESNREQIENLLNPLRERIGHFEQQVKQTYEHETRDRLALKSEIVNLQKLSQQVSSDANNLANALKGETRTQGAWGEMILERIFELSGLERGREYETQVNISIEGGRRRPDAVVHLPDGRDVIVDAKVSLTAFSRLGEAVDATERRTRLTEHVQSIRTHIKGLSVKEYQSLPGIESLDFVLMFVPSEAAYIEALRAAPDLYEDALARNVALVSPSTLLPTLRTVENLWNIERQGQNAQKIAEEAGKLYDQFVLFETALSDVGDKLGKAQNAYDTARKRLIDGRGNLVRRTEQLRVMGARASKALPADLVREANEDDETLEAPDEAEGS
ncbi:MAG: DNA recombination protein RmuC [Pseudomonadota bacterium]|jgi:DNA recombination protein RmuC|nr:DNA recombination protein RmuC [Pseudomonadota bacterium]